MIGSPLGPREVRTIAALVCQPTVRAGAKVAGVGQRTLRRWMGRPDFVRCLRAASLAGRLKDDGEA